MEVRSRRWGRPLGLWMVAALGAGVVAYGLTSRSPGAPPRAGAAPSTRDDAATEGPARDVGDGALAAGAPRDRVPQDVASSAEEHGTLALGARVLVRVTDAIDGSALPSATVDASVGLGAGGALGVTRSARSRGDGTFELRRMPIGRAVDVDVGAPGHLRRRLTVDASTDLERTVDVALDRALSPEQAAARLAVEGPADALAQAARFVVTDARGGTMLVEAGALYGIDDRPTGRETADVVVRVALPGWLGPEQPLTLHRGRTTVVPTSMPPAAVLEVTARDPRGVPIEGAAVEVAPHALAGVVGRALRVTARTDAAGRARLALRQGDGLEVHVTAPTHAFPTSGVVLAVDADRVPFVAVGVPRTPVVLELDGAEADADASAKLAWTDATLAPPTVERLVALGDGRSPGHVADDERALLPTSARVDRDGGARARASLALLPGAYAVRVTLGARATLATSFVVTDAPLSVRLVLGALVRRTFRVAPDGGDARPSPYAGAIWIAHVAGWDERHRLAQAAGAPWRDAATAFLAGRGDAAAVVRWAGAAVRPRRGVHPDVAADVGWVDETGRVEVDAHAATAGGTLVLGDGRAVVIEPAPGDGDVVRVAPARFQRVVVRFVDGAGRPRAGLVVGVDAAVGLAAGQRDLTSLRSTDAAGELVVGGIAGDEFGVVPPSGTWLPAETVGATAAWRLAPQATFGYAAIRVDGAGVARVVLEARGP